MTTKACPKTGVLSKICPKCPGGPTLKPVTEFYARSAKNGDGYQNMCIACNAVISAEWTKKRRATIQGRATKLSHDSRRRSQKKGWPTSEMSPEYIISLYKQQDGRCAVTGLPFDLEPHPKFGKNPLAPSLDRINSDLYYTKVNVQLVCHIYNNAKSTYTDNIMLQMATGIVRKALHDQPSGQKGVSGVVLAQAAEPRVVIPEDEASTVSGHPTDSLDKPVLLSEAFKYE